jgi:hypothetical protein
VRKLQIFRKRELGLHGRVVAAHDAHVLIVEQRLLVVVRRQLAVEA